MNIDKLVNRFLAWPLPNTVCSDRCVSMPEYPRRSGTNLLTATEADMRRKARRNATGNLYGASKEFCGVCLSGHLPCVCERNAQRTET